MKLIERTCFYDHYNKAFANAVMQTLGSTAPISASQASASDTKFSAARSAQQSLPRPAASGSSHIRQSC
jgi:hypothetical protein